MQLGSIVLAGGRSRRMGRPKEALRLGGATVLGRTVALLTACAAPVAVVRRDAGQRLPELPAGVLMAEDGAPGGGPLQAIAAGLRALLDAGLRPDDAAFATGCDAPFLSAAAVGWLARQLGDRDAAMPRAGGVLQPLCAVYRLRCLGAVDALLAAGVSTPRTLAERVDCAVLDEPTLRAFDPQLEFLRGMNTPDEYEAARRALEERP